MDTAEHGLKSRRSFLGLKPAGEGWAAWAVLFAMFLGVSGVAFAAPVSEVREVVVFHAGSLSLPFKRLAEAFMAENPGVTVLLEAAGSRACARKITDLGRRCDVMASADHAVIDTLLIPDWAEWNIRFATNELGIAFLPTSRRAGEVLTASAPGWAGWPDILLDRHVAFGRSDPDSDPCGYRTVQMFHLAERFLARPGLAGQLTAKDHRFIRPKETDLLALLESGTIDYLFIYRSVAVQHGLSFLRLPPELNLADPARAEEYAAGTVTVSGASPGTTMVLRGEPIVYGVTIPRNAPAPDMAVRFVAFLLAPEHGGRLLRDLGQEPISPALVADPTVLPLSLQPFTTKEPQ
jgi:molybdate/tungstate transport system substrate-binding protein